MRARMLGVVLGVERVDHVRDRDVLRAPRRRRTRRPLGEPMLSTARRLGLQHAHDWLADEFVGPRAAAAWRLGARLCLAESCLDEGLAHLDRRRRASATIKGDCTSSDQAVAIKGDCTSSDQAEVVPPSIGAVALLFFLGFALRERVKARCTELMGTSRNSANGAGYLKQGGHRGGHGCRQGAVVGICMPWRVLEARGRNQRPSAAIGCRQWNSEALRDTQRHSVAHRGRQRPSEALSGTQRRSGALRRTAQGAEACPCS